MESQYVWSLIDSDLYYGPSGATMFTLGDNVSTSASVETYNAQSFGYSISKYTVSDSALNHMDFCLKQSHDKRYGIVYSKTRGWVDFFGLFPRDITNADTRRYIEEGRIPPDSPKRIFSLKVFVHPFSGGDAFVELIKAKSGATLCVTTTNIGDIEIYEMAGKQLIRNHLGEYFFKNFYISLNSDHLVMKAVTPELDEAILYINIQKLLEDPTYHGAIVDTSKGTAFDKWINESEGKYQLTNNKVFDKAVLC